MQIAPIRTNPVSTTDITRAVTILAFTVLALATGLAMFGVDFFNPPTTATAGYTALFVVGVLASVTLFLPIPMIAQNRHAFRPLCCRIFRCSNHVAE